MGNERAVGVVAGDSGDEEGTKPTGHTNSSESIEGVSLFFSLSGAR